MGFSGSTMPANNSITTAMLQDGAVTSAKITNNAITVTKLASGLGTPVLLHDDETEVTFSVTTASVKSYTLPNNTYSNIFIEAEIGYDLLLAAENIDWDIQVGGSTKRHLDVQCGSSSGFSREWRIGIILVQQTSRINRAKPHSQRGHSKL